MKKSYVYIGLLIVLSVVMTGCLGGMRISEDTTGKIVGIVYDGVDKDVTEVALTLGSITIHPDATGEFTFPNVDFGLHELIIKRFPA